MVITERTTKERRSASRQEAGSDLLTVHEVAQRLRVDDTTVRRWIKSGAMEAVYLPHSGKRHVYRIKRETLDKLFGSVEVA
jgi:excisionase family DNA binding protein